MDNKFSKVFDICKNFASKHSPEILTGIGIAGMIVTVVTAVKETPKALRLVEEMKKEKQDPKPIDTVKVAWKCYIPSTLIGVSSIACLIFASRQNVRKNAALAAAYTLSESTLTEYKQKVIEKIGKKKEDEICADIAKDKIEKNPVGKNEIIFTGKGETLCYDSVSGRYFKSDIEKLRKAENIINLRLRDEMWVSLNEFYYEIGLQGISLGEDLGWNIDKGYVSLRFDAQLSEDETPCLVISYSVVPYYNYQ